MTPDLATAAPSVITAFSQTGGILGLIILSLLLIVGLVAYMAWKFMSDLMANHEKRMDVQESRHQSDRTATNVQWQQVTREITTDMKHVLAEISSKQGGAIITLERIDRGVEALKRRKAA